ncbi:hypothetical protein C2S19_07085 [Helicobacter pylori]|nr:hypothetical protein C2S19_07085 [Helicobacter pylori]
MHIRACACATLKIFSNFSLAPPSHFHPLLFFWLNCKPKLHALLDAKRVGFANGLASRKE